MKLNKYSWLAILPMIFTACQEDMLVKEQQQDKIYTLTANMDGDAVMSRAQIQLGKTSSGEELFFWNENDEFDLYLNENTEPKIFMIEDGGGQKEATFTTTTPVPIEEDYVAVYPSGVSMEENAFKFNINNNLDFYSFGQTGTWEKYLQENMFMIAQGKFEYPDDAKVSFSHLCSMIRISYSNQTDQDMDINTISVSSETQKFSTQGNYSLDNGFSTTPGNSCTLFTDGLSVKAKTTADFYILFFPEEFSNEEDAVISFEIGTDNWERDRDVLIDLAAIKEADANKDDAGFKAGKRYWFKVTETDKGLAWTNYTKTVEVDDITSFKEAMESPTVTHVALKNPIYITENANIQYNGYKVILPSDNNFTWSINGVDENALIINKTSNFYLGQCTIQGEIESTANDKYLIKNTVGEISLSNMNLKAEGHMNAVKIENSVVYMFDKVSIEVENDCDALSVISSTSRSSVSISIDGKIIGNVCYESNAATSDNAEWFSMSSGTLEGDIITSGSSVNDLYVQLGEEVKYTGVDMAEVASLADFQKYVNNNAIKKLVLKNPIIFPETDNRSNYNLDPSKTISMSSDFSWLVDGKEYDALFINNRGENMELYLMYCSIEGDFTSTDADTQKYLIESNGGTMYLWNSKLTAKNDMNAVKVVSSDFRLDEQSTIDVAKNNAFFIQSSEDKKCDVRMSEGTSVKGNIKFESNYYRGEEDGNDWFWMGGGTLNGDFITSGKNVQYLTIEIDEDAVYNGSNTLNVSSLDDFKKIIRNDAISEVKLLNPIKIDEKIKLEFSKAKNISMHEDFTWGNENVALFIYNVDAEQSLNNWNLIGTEDNETDKFLFEMNAGSLYLYNINFDANGLMNAIKLKDSQFNLSGEESLVDVESKDKLALLILSDNKRCDVYLSEGTVNGNISYVGGFMGNDGSDNFTVYDTCELNGDLVSYSGDYAMFWNVGLYNENFNAGEGWNEWFIVKLQKQLENHESAYVNHLTIKEDITFSFDDSRENAYFKLGKVDGNGKITFLNTGTKEVCLQLEIQNLGDDVTLEFGDNIKKILDITTNRVKEIFEMGCNQDDISVKLKSDATIDESIMVSETLNNQFGQGSLTLDLNEKTLTWNEPIIMKSGNLKISPWETNGTINASKDFIQVGSDVNSDRIDEVIYVNIGKNVNINSQNSWISVVGNNEETAANKKVTIELSNLQQQEDKVGKVAIGKGYSNADGGNLNIY